MPEGSEVLLISEVLAGFCKNRGIVSIEILDQNNVKTGWINRNLKDFNKFQGWLAMHNGFLPIESVNTKGKLCWVQCVDDIHIRIQFGMSGNFRQYPTDDFLKIFNENRVKSGKKPESMADYLKHCHLKLGVAPMDDHTRVSYIMYHDVRRFGRWTFSNNPNELKIKLNSLGTDPLSEKLSDEVILKKFRQHNGQNICSALMNNGIISSVGNYIKSTTLYDARIYPLACVKDIPDNALLELYGHIIKIGKDAYEQQGASLYTYSGIKGEQSKFKDQLIIYGHEGEKDPNGYRIIRIPADRSPDGRSTFWVPEVQIIGKPDPKPQPKPIKKLIIIKKKPIQQDDQDEEKVDDSVEKLAELSESSESSIKPKKLLIKKKFSHPLK